MKNVLFASFDLEIGGVERSLVSLLKHFDYEKHSVDLMLYKHQGEFMDMIPEEVNLLSEIQEYATFRKSVKEIFSEKRYGIGITRLLAKLCADCIGKIKRLKEPGTLQMQLMWKWALPFLPHLNKEYDVAISYLWPHNFVAEKVNAKNKIAWIHTDLSQIETNEKLDLKMWNQFDHIIAVSEACKESFIQKYRVLENKVRVMENLTSPTFVKTMGDVDLETPMTEDQRFKLLTVARLSHAKGIDLAVQALKRLSDKGFKNIAWYVVGYGGDDAKIKELIWKNNLEDQFILLGKQTNPYPFMKKADLYVQPSRYEGKAVTVGEAQILGLPVLITNYNTAKSQIIHGKDGLICDLSAEGIASGIEKLYKNPKLRNKLRVNCQQNDYNNTHMLKKLYQISI